MNLSNVFVTEKQKDFLELIIHTDAANSIGGEKGELGNAVQWCIDACMKIEALYDVDACYVGNFDIRLPEHDPTATNTEAIKRGMSNVYWNNAQIMTQEQFTNWMCEKAKLSEPKVEEGTESVV